MDTTVFNLLLLTTLLDWTDSAPNKLPCVIETVNGMPTTWYEKMRFQRCTREEIRGFAEQMNHCLVKQTSDNQQDIKIRMDTAQGNTSTLCMALDGVAACYTLMFTAPCLVEQEVNFFQQEYLSTKSLLNALCNGSTATIIDRINDGSIECLAKIGLEHTCCEMEAAKDLPVAETSSVCRYFQKTGVCLEKHLTRCSDDARQFLVDVLRSDEYMIGCNEVMKYTGAGGQMKSTLDFLVLATLLAVTLETSL